MSRQFFDDEMAEIEAHIATFDAVTAMLAKRIEQIEKLRARAVASQRQMQEFVNMLAQLQTAANAEKMAESATHAATSSAH